MLNKKPEIHYTTGKDFTTNSASGVYGGIAGNGQICMNFYIDRIPLPDKVELIITDEGAKEGKHFGNESVGVREVITCISMDIDVAKSFHTWLGGKIAELDNAILKSKQ
jgi:hypothetical protein